MAHGHDLAWGSVCSRALKLSRLKKKAKGGAETLELGQLCTAYPLQAACGRRALSAELCFSSLRVPEAQSTGATVLISRRGTPATEIICRRYLPALSGGTLTLLAVPTPTVSLSGTLDSITLLFSSNHLHRGLFSPANVQGPFSLHSLPSPFLFHSPSGLASMR